MTTKSADKLEFPYDFLNIISDAVKSINKLLEELENDN